MVITDFLERNARLYGSETALVQINPSDERDQAATWRELNLIAAANPDAPYRREMSWKDFDRRANRFANLLLSRGLQRGRTATGLQVIGERTRANRCLFGALAHLACHGALRWASC